MNRQDQRYNKWIGREAEREMGRETEREIGRYADRQVDRYIQQVDKQNNSIIIMIIDNEQIIHEIPQKYQQDSNG